MKVENVLKALSTVQEPDLGKDLVTLNMVRDIVINGNDRFIYSCSYHTCLSFKRPDKNNCVYKPFIELIGNEING